MKEIKAIDENLFSQKNGITTLPENYCRLREIWLLRGLQCCRSKQSLDELFELSSSKQRRLLETLGMIDVAAPLPKKIARLSKQLNRVWVQSQNQPPIERSGHPFDHLVILGQELGLTTVEQEILLFCVMLDNDPILCNGMDLLGDLNSYEIRQLLAIILDLPTIQIQQALAQNSLLLTSGLLEPEDQGRYNPSGCMSRWFNPMPQLVRIAIDPLSEPNSLFRECLHPASDPELRPADYAHIRREFGLLTRLLQRAATQGVRGVNILLYGDAGTGKTQLAHTVAHATGLMLYQVSANRDHSHPHDAEDRLAAFRLAQTLLKQRHDCLLLFDESGDVLINSQEGQTEYQQLSKLWLNQTLETNPIPTIWTCNDLYEVEDAFQRRFDHILELVTPPATVRQRMLARHLGDLSISDTALNRLAKTADLAPGHLQQATKVLKLLGYQNPTRNERCLDHLLGQRTLQFGEEKASHPATTALSDFDLELLRVDVDLPRLIRGLARQRQGRLCFYGLPGTGKSAFATWLAQQLEMPLLRKQASDLLGMFVGQTEQHIAKMFKDTREQKAMLLIDEADTFLRSRRSAHQRWEVSQVNELLVQMERFEGILICATNLMDKLDEAVLRRFDLKLCFHPLNAIQVERRFRQLMTGTESVDEAELAATLQKLRALNNLTPGDFAVVQRQARLLDQPLTPNKLLDVLTAESRAKPDSRHRPIGFVN